MEQDAIYLLSDLGENRPQVLKAVFQVCSIICYLGDDLLKEGKVLFPDRPKAMETYLRLLTNDNGEDSDFNWILQWVLYFSVITAPLYELAKSSVRASLLRKPRQEPADSHLEEVRQQSASRSTPNYKKPFHVER